jgi:hypothetical protein
MRNWNGLQIAALVLGTSVPGCGHIVPLNTEGLLGGAVISGTDGTRTDGSDVGNIYAVTTVIAATQGNPFATLAELPFTGPVRAFGNTATDAQWPFYFVYTYPANNYKLSEAHLVADLTRDTSETEGIFVDGIFSGQGAQGNVTSTQITDHIYKDNTYGQAPNFYFQSFPTTHYRHSTRNSFDLLIDNLITSTPALTKKTVDLVKDGRLNVVTGDDAAAFSASLVLKGYTISKEPLNCVNSSNFNFQNVFMHNDGNTISQAAFSGPVVNPYTSTQPVTAATGFQSVEWHYDAALPQVTTANITISSATIGGALLTSGAVATASNFILKRDNTISPKAAIVINGVGIAETGFDKSLATGAVESWESGAAVTYWENWLTANVPNTNTATTVTLDLVAMLGATKVRTLIAQGKLNVAVAGSLVWVTGSGLSSTRSYSPVVTVDGPDLVIAGSYFTELCTIPNNPSSPLSDDEELPADAGDTTSPSVTSLAASEITSTSAKVQWLTNESATSRVGYGIGNTATLTTVDANRVTFHSVTLTGLQPYKVYTIRAHSADYNGNLTISASKTFQTLR